MMHAITASGANSVSSGSRGSSPEASLHRSSAEAKAQAATLDLGPDMQGSRPTSGSAIIAPPAIHQDAHSSDDEDQDVLEGSDTVTQQA